MIFDDRKHAAKALVPELEAYRCCKDTLVVGIPRGGVVLADIIGKALELPVDITCPRKIGAPHNPEFAIGAITETGDGYFNDAVIAHLQITDDYIEETVQEEKAVAQHRLDLFRRGMPKRDVSGKTVILVDDGLATGATMKAAIVSMRSEGATNVIVAVPVSPPDTLMELKKLADKVVCLSAPMGFMAVGQYYHDFGEVTDDEVVAILRKP
jgi:putative phosphoribosyl transferase